MKKSILIITIILSITLITGCGCSKKETKNKEKEVVKNQIYEGLEFVNVGAKNGVIKTVIINNTGYTYEGSKISIKIMDSNGNVIVTETAEVKEKVETGTTKEIETKTKADLKNAVSVEYSIIN